MSLDESAAHRPGGAHQAENTASLEPNWVRTASSTTLASPARTAPAPLNWMEACGSPVAFGCILNLRDTPSFSSASCSKRM